MKNVSVSRQGRVLLDHVSADLPQGQVTALIGPNGAGKTTLLKAILGLIRYQGTIDCPGQRRRPKLAYVPQQAQRDSGNPLRVVDLLATRLQRWPVWAGLTQKSQDGAAEVLQRVSASNLIDRPVGKLSGGEWQRVMLALALLAKPDILLLDEPVSGVDPVGGQLFCDLLEDLCQKRGISILWVSHDLSVVSEHATHVICLNRQICCTGVPSSVLDTENLSKIYGPHHAFYHHHGGSHAGHYHHHK